MIRNRTLPNGIDILVKNYELCNSKYLILNSHLILDGLEQLAWGAIYLLNKSNLNEIKVRFSAY